MAIAKAAGKLIQTGVTTGLEAAGKAVKEAAPDFLSGFTKRVDGLVSAKKIAPQSGNILTRSAAESTDNIGPMGQMLDGLEKGDQTLTGNLDEFLQQKGFAYHQADQGLAEGAQRAELTGKAVELDPKVKLDSFISQNQIDLSTAPKGRMMTIQGMQDVPMYPGTKEELLPKIQQYIDLQKEAGSKQPKGGWEKIFGHVADEEGTPLRITGGVDKPGRWQKHNMPSRKFAEQLFSEGEDKARLKIMSAQGNQKHHAEWAIKESEIFGTTEDGVPRAAEDLDYIDSEIKRRFGIDFGNKDAQEIAQSQRAHMGVKGDEVSSQLASHRILDNISDVQGFRDWQFEASDIKFEMPPGSKPKVKWFKNKDGIIYEPARGQKDGKAIGDMKSFKELYPEAEAVAFKMPGTKGGTYSPVQRHGFSQELITTIRKLHDPEDVIKAIGLFKEAGIGDLRKGASALASTILEKNQVDPQTTKWIQANMQEALDVADVMKRQPGIKEIPEFQKFINSMEEIQRDLKGKNY